MVYARCGEFRVIPIEIENETRKVREDVSVEVSDVRSAGGRDLGWQVGIDKQGPLTLQPVQHDHARAEGAGTPVVTTGGPTRSTSSRRRHRRPRGARQSPQRPRSPRC